MENNKVKNTINIIVFFFLTLIGSLFFIIILPFIVISYPYTYYKSKKFEKQYSDFLMQNNESNFFCYNNSKKSKEFIETEIIPCLDKQIEVVYLNGKQVETENYSKEFISNALYSLRNYSRYPHLMKIREGKLVDKSINSLFFSVKNQNKSKDKLLVEIHNFFELN